MSESSLGDLRAAIAKLEGTFATELKHLTDRMEQVEIVQRDLVSVATQGRTGLKVLLWVGGGLAGLGAILASFWDKAFG